MREAAANALDGARASRENLLVHQRKTMSLVERESADESLETRRLREQMECERNAWSKSQLRERYEASLEGDKRRQVAAREQAARASRQASLMTAQDADDYDTRMNAWFDQCFDARLGEGTDENLGLIGAIGNAIGANCRAVRKDLGAAIAALRSELEAAKAELKAIKNLPGKLPPAKTWAPHTVGYEGDIFHHAGAFWQAKKDTAHEPGPGADWVSLAGAGRDRMSPTPRGEYDPHDAYSRLDIVTRNGHLYTCVSDNPGVPGQCDDWMLLASRGPAGALGKAAARGHKGDRGPSGAKIVAWKINREGFFAIPFMSDGTAGAPLRQRDLFEEFLRQTKE
jgi:hypothetical protein